MYTWPLCLKLQYTFGTGIDVLCATNCMAFASANVVKAVALMQSLDETRRICLRCFRRWRRYGFLLSL